MKSCWHGFGTYNMISLDIGSKGVDLSLSLFLLRQLGFYFSAY